MSEQATVPSKASPEPRLAYVIYDTNTAMHCKRADQIDWPALTKCDEVILVATPIFLKELDKHKNTHPSRRLRNRAKDYMSWLLSFSRDPALEIVPRCGGISCCTNPFSTSLRTRCRRTCPTTS